jgi:hypothetical protein
VGEGEGRGNLRGLEVRAEITSNHAGVCLSSFSTLSALAEALHRFDPPWIKLGRIHRRVCFLRSEGRAIDARRLEEGDFAQAKAEALAAGGPDADARLRSFLAEEEERAAGAIACVDLLLPELSERAAALGSALGAQAPAQRPPRPVDSGAERGIADFIDEMLAQDRARAR